MSRVSRQLGELLVDRRLLSRDVMEQLILRERDSGDPFARILVTEGHVSDTNLLEVVAERLGLQFIDLDDAAVQPEAMDRLETEVATRMQAIPVRVDEDRVVVAVADPFARDLQTTLETACGSPVTLALAPKRSIDRILGGVSGGVSGGPGSGGPETTAAERLHMNDLLQILVGRKGSDLHLTAGSAPQIRVNGSLQTLEQFGMMMPAELRRIVYEVLTNDQRQRLEDNRELDASHPVPGHGRFRVNVFYQRDSVGAVLRAIPNEIVSLTELGIPSVVESFAQLHRGLVLVTGPTGSGKSTTLASLVDRINATRSVHIMTIEDPIEFLHRHKKAIVNQREVGTDTHGFADALRHVLRQDPDVILVGELRDLETISAALTASETGHLVFGTLHTQSAPQSIDRMIDVFPAHQQEQVRVMLAGSLQGVVSQQLLPTADGTTRVVAVEVMVATAAIRNMVREGKVHQIPSSMQAGGKYGMQTMDQSLAKLVKEGRIKRELAIERALDQEAILQHLAQE